MADWYVANLGLHIVREVPGRMVFLADSEGVVVMELYTNRDAAQLELQKVEPLSLHIAFEVSDPATAAEELVRAGASIEVPVEQVGNDTMVMLRDPFGLPLQLVRRGEKMRRNS